MILEILDPAPGDIQRRIARDQIPQVALALLPAGKQLSERVAATGEQEVHRNSLLIDVADAVVELAKIDWSRGIGRGKCLAHVWRLTDRNAANVREFLLGVLIDEAAKSSFIHEREAHQS